MARRQAGAKTLSGSVEAKRKAAVMLEALAGLRTTQSASDELDIALARYYVLETRMLQGMIDALEPRARGRKRSHEAEMKLQVEENERLRRELMQLQTLYRATQRALGVKEDREAKKSAARTTRERRPRKKTRGERVLRGLRATSDDTSSSNMAAGDPQGGQP